LNPDLAIERTRAWLRRFVIGLGLCPFASRPLEAGRLVCDVCEADDLDGIYRSVLRSLEAFLLADPGRQETALVIVPRGLGRFDVYLEMLALLDEALDDSGLRGRVQLASFHPDYRFEGAPDDDPANFTNRSPLPMFHLIREDLLSEALAGHPDPERIPQRNVALLRRLGTPRVRTLAMQQTVDD
jgi:hypothetical protein